MTAVIGIGILVGNQLGSYEVGGIGLFSLMILVTYTLGLRVIYRDQQGNQQPPADSPVEHLESERSPKAVVHSVVGFLIASMVIIISAPYSASAAETIAKLSGLGETFVGTTMIALATSLPELVACIAAVRMGAMDLAIGNVFGSNTFNLLLMIPLDAAYPGSLVGSVDTIHLLTCMFVILVTSVVIIGQLYRVESRVLLVEPDAALILLLVTTGLALIYFCK